MKKILFYITIIAFFAACSKVKISDFELDPPRPNFAITNSNCKAPCSVTFTNASKGAGVIDYLWDFGDGGTTKETNPQHFYFEGGDYTVKLIAKNANGFNFIEKKVSIQEDKPLGLFGGCRIEKIMYVKIPPTKPDGSPWDDLPGNQANPELQWLVRDNLNRIYGRGQELAEFVNFDQKLLPFLAPRDTRSFSIRPFINSFEIVIQDADDNSEDIIGTFSFSPITYFPDQPDPSIVTNSRTEIRVVQQQGKLEYIVTLGWQ